MAEEEKKKPEAGEKGKAPEGEAGQKKKGGKLPIIVILALVLAGGGFFAMKSKKPKAPPPVVMGTTEDIGEFLVNMRGGTIYLRTTISVGFKKGFEKKDLDESMAAVKYAIILVLRSKGTGDIRDTAGMTSLTHELAANVNKVLEAAEAAKKPPQEPQPDAAGDADKAEGDANIPIPNGWDSATGPALKIYFTSFATQ